MTKPTTTQNNTATVGAQFIAPEASPEHGQKGGVSGWREYELQELVDVRDGTHDSPKESAIGKHLVTSKHIKNGKIDLTSAYKISENDFELVNKRSKVDQWDILFSMIGTIGEMAIVTDRPEFAIKNVGLFKTNGNKLLSQWIYYYFKSTEAQAEIQASLKGSTQQYITLGDLRVFPIKIPSEKEQKAIAAMLSSLDDKIDLLHRQNQTLEAMAQTLFRQWFIEEAREDWVEMAIFDIAKHIKVGVQPSKLPTIEFSHYSLPAFDAGKQPILELGQAILSNKYAVLDKTILVSKLNPRVPRVWGVHKAPSNSICSTEFQVIKPNNTDYFEFLYFFLCSSNATDELSMSASGTSGSHQRVSPEDIMNLTFFTEGLEMIKEFSLLVSASLVKIQSNIDSIQTLTQLRDTLLPKLMSGEIRVEVEYE